MAVYIKNLKEPTTVTPEFIKNTVKTIMDENHKLNVEAKKILEIDVDGVLGNLYSPIEEVINKEFSIPFSFKKDVKNFGLKGVNEEIRQRIFQLFRDPNIIINEPLYYGAKKFLKDLYKFAEANNYQIVIHTHMLSDEVAVFRKIWLEALITELNLKNVKVIIDCGNCKTMLKNNNIVIEDCIENLCNSKAALKILRSMPHNKENANKELLKTLKYSRCSSYRKIIETLKEYVA